MIRKLIAVLFAACAAFGACADTWTDPETDYTWTYHINGDTAEISNSVNTAAISPSPTGFVAIPSTLGDKPVTSIGPYAFNKCGGITSVTIPNTVTNIGPYAFGNCSGLTRVEIPDYPRGWVACVAIIASRRYWKKQ